MELYNEYLYHHGVKGMRWGVRRYQNKDGSLTAAGRKKYRMTEDGQKQLADQVKQHYKTSKKNNQLGTAEERLVKDNEVVKGMHKSNRLKNARRELEELGHVMDEYDQNTNTRYKYKIKAASEILEESEESLRKKYRKDDIWLMYEDWDQGSNSSVDMYLRDRGSSLSKYQNDVINAQNKYKDACKKATEELLGKYGNTKIDRQYRWQDDTVAGAVNDALFDLAEIESRTWYAYY